MKNDPKLLVTLLTGRTIDQGVGKEQGKASKDYIESVAVCCLDPEDLKCLAIKEKTNVQVSTDYGTVVLKALKSSTGPHQGTVFIPYGPWANAVASTETDSTGMPTLKGIPARVEPAPHKPVLSLGQLLKELFGKEYNGSC